ncbi:hypothetical protein [Winogradskyella sp. MIT101101]|uniref:hypothetical protein n=1 Tax=Winogradskyella sp. MIT101101 TaxID=3098297 RepID=UPI00399BCC77
MKLTNDQFEEVAYIFEKANGNSHSDYEKGIISASELTKFKPTELEQIIVDGLEKSIYDGSTDRISAYWALGKRFNRNLIPLFKKWLQKEFDLKDPQAVYQLLISLGNMEEPVFNPDRDGGSASWETELNLRDAKAYLNK